MKQLPQIPVHGIGIYEALTKLSHVIVKTRTLRTKLDDHSMRYAEFRE